MSPKTSEAYTLEQYRVALDNAEMQPVIATALAKMGYGPEKIKEGKMLFSRTRESYDSNLAEGDQTQASYSVFTTSYASIRKFYGDHRRKAKVVFRKDPVMLSRLMIDGAMPRAYVKWVEMVRKFYMEISIDEKIMQQLTALGVTAEEVEEVDKLSVKIEASRTEYLREKSESKEATRVKNAAFAKMNDWMRDFYAVARIALSEHPQLLEALGKNVKG